MADFSIKGHIISTRYASTCVIVTVEEYRNGYKTQNGKVVEDKQLDWKVFFKPYFKKYISEHFMRGSYVAIKGEIAPYALHDGKVVEGYTIMGQTINIAPYPKNVRKENKMIAESQSHASEEPDIEAFDAPDF